MFDAHVANSDYTAEELRRAMRPPHIRPVHVSPMGIELPSPLHPYVRASIRRKLLDRCGAPDGDLLLYAGRLSPEKNVEVLPDVLASLAGRARPVFLVVAGDGPLRDTLQTRAAALAAGPDALRRAHRRLVSPRPADGKRRRVRPSESEGTVRDRSTRGARRRHASRRASDRRLAVVCDRRERVAGWKRCLESRRRRRPLPGRRARPPCEGGTWGRDRVAIRMVRERVTAAAALRSGARGADVPLASTRGKSADGVVTRYACLTSARRRCNG